ncbi:MAG: hypothetical protein K6E34_12980 [Lachnospiraceae bacterium]|nr:hypothetical protein [Lachnospiraceae bacterium]
MFTIKSISDEGTFYLNKNWEKNKSFWKYSSELKIEDMYKTASAAKSSLTKLLKVMGEYLADSFFLIETDENNRIVSETSYIPHI